MWQTWGQTGGHVRAGGGAVRMTCGNALCCLPHVALTGPSRNWQLSPKNLREHSVLVFSVLRIFHVNFLIKICLYDPILDTHVFGIKPKSHSSPTNRFLLSNDRSWTFNRTRLWVFFLGDGGTWICKGRWVSMAAESQRSNCGRHHSIGYQYSF